MKALFVGLLVVHGLLHLLGFAKYALAMPLPALTGRTLVRLSPLLSKASGWLWLCASLIMLATATALYLGRSDWRGLALAGVLLSQALIVHAWPDAKAGTLPNLVVLVALLISAKSASFARETDAAVRELVSSAQPIEQRPVRRQDLDGLPTPVRRWLERSGVIGQPWPRVVSLRQRAHMTTSPGGGAMPALAEQTFTLMPPGFVWGVDVTMYGLPIVGRDSYREGRGAMLIKAAGLVPIVDAHGDAIDQGTLLRFMGELVWFPSAALSPYLRWSALDDTHARLTMTHAGVSASADFEIDAEGHVLEMRAQRFYTGDGPARLTSWGNRCHEWKRLGDTGVLVPSRGEVYWSCRPGASATTTGRSPSFATSLDLPR